MRRAEKASRTPNKARARCFRTVKDSHERYRLSLDLEELKMIRDTAYKRSSSCSSAPCLYHGCACPGVGKVVSVDECDPWIPRTVVRGLRVHCSAEMFSHSLVAFKRIHFNSSKRDVMSSHLHASVFLADAVGSMKLKRPLHRDCHGLCHGLVECWAYLICCHSQVHNNITVSGALFPTSTSPTADEDMTNGSSQHKRVQ